MNKELLKELKEKLEKEKIQIEKNLKSFAERDKKLEGDWNARFPKWEKGGSSSNLEIAADEVEEYSTLLPLEYILEIRLKNINLALEKIRTSLSARTLNASHLRTSPSARTLNASHLRTSLSARTLNASHLKKPKYGICEKCGKEIPANRLKAYPEARFCLKCK